MSAHKRKRYNLQHEVARCQTQHRDGLIDGVTLKTHSLRIGRELANLTPQADGRTGRILPRLANFGALWRQMPPEEKRTCCW